MPDPIDNFALAQRLEATARRNVSRIHHLVDEAAARGHDRPTEETKEILRDLAVHVDPGNVRAMVALYVTDAVDGRPVIGVNLAGDDALLAALLAQGSIGLDGARATRDVEMRATITTPPSPFDEFCAELTKAVRDLGESIRAKREEVGQ